MHSFIFVYDNGVGNDRFFCQRNLHNDSFFFVKADILQRIHFNIEYS